MSCPILTDDRVQLLLEGGLPESEWAALRAHLCEPCEACLERLAGARR